MSILKYKNEKELIERANNSEYGLASAIITKDINKMFEFSKKLHSGTVWVNGLLIINKFRLSPRYIKFNF